MNFNKHLKDFLVGTLLGDAHIGKTGLNKAFISFEHSSKKTEYLNYLFYIAKENKIPLTLAFASYFYSFFPLIFLNLRLL